MKEKRPISPHLQIYAWSISSFTSIFHRLTGVLLYFAILAMSWYIIFYVYQLNINNVNNANETCDCPIKNIIYYSFITIVVIVIFSLYYHLCNGIRHLFWDIGKGFDTRVAKRNGLLAILLSVVLTAVTACFVSYFKFM
jgi:succinate dehydrogenase / fumarate reductase cytochrome b subunit